MVDSSYHDPHTAFDTIDHDKIIQRLETFGFICTALQLVPLWINASGDIPWCYVGLSASDVHGVPRA